MKAPGDDNQQPNAQQSGAALRAGVVAFSIDQFDIYLPVVVLASIGGYFLPAGLSPTTSSVLTALIFASTLITRPIGAAIFGHIADVTGRKHATLLATGGFGIITLMIALLPGASSIGGASIGLLIMLRTINGVFLGGAYTAAVPLAMESTPKARRGIVAGWILSASPAAYAVLALITLLLQQVMPSAGLTSAYARWGWRIPFLLGALLAFALVMYYRRAVTEPKRTHSPAPSGRRRPLTELFTGRQRRALLQVLILMSGVWLANNMVSAVLPGLLGGHLHLTGPQVSLTMAFEAIALAVSLPLYGALSQRLGRRRFYLGYGILMAIVGSSLYALLMTAHPAVPTTIALTTLIGLTTLGTFGPVGAYLTERFPTETRATGFGVGYSLALVVPAFYAFYLEGLSNIMPAHLSPVPLIVLAGLLVLTGAALGPETRDTDLTR